LQWMASKQDKQLLAEEDSVVLQDRDLLKDCKVLQEQREELEQLVVVVAEALPVEAEVKCVGAVEDVVVGAVEPRRLLPL